jgi:nucleoside-diphosphate-sugar epimerase
MHITIFGATGRTGQHLVEQALARGHTVIAFSRSPDKLKVNSKDIQVVQGDVQNSNKVEEAVAGAEAVLSVLGPTENKPTYAVSKGTQNILSAMQKHGVDRLILSAGAGVGDPKDEPKFFNRAMNFLLKRVSRWVYEDMVNTVEAVRDSEVKWTIVRVPMLTDNKPTGKVVASYVGKGMGPRITRADMASFILEQLESDAFIHQAPAISN